MSNYFHANQFQHLHTQTAHPMSQPYSHHGRSRRAPRLSASQNSQRQQRVPKVIKEATVADAPHVTAYWTRFEAGRSFDLDDDLEFCPNLLSFDERQSVGSTSDRSSLSSGSPEASPTQQQIRPQNITPALSISSAAIPAFVPPPSFISNNNINNSHLKIHQPSAIRTRNAIPIVNPTTGSRIASPPSSVSPGMMQASAAAHRW